MGQSAFWRKGLAAICLVFLGSAGQADALGLRGIGLKVGMDLARESNQFSGTQFDTARLMLGAHLDLGSVVIPRLHLVPGLDVIIQDELKIYSLNWDTRYLFVNSANSIGYVGGGIGVHLNRFDIAAPSGGTSSLNLNDTKFSLNIPIGFQKRLSKGLLWFGELKLVIADDEVDSSFRFSVGLTIGSGS